MTIPSFRRLAVRVLLAPRPAVTVLRAAAIFFVCLLCVGAPLLAQNANDGYAPSSDGSIYAITLQADGKALVGGAFTAINGSPCHNLCRVNVDGSVDGNFVDPNINDAVYAIAVQSDGKVWIGGLFTLAAGGLRHSLARLNADGSLDTSVADANFATGVIALALRPDGKVWAGGSRLDGVGQPHRTLTLVNADGTVNGAFADPLADGDVLALALQPNGKLWVGGAFTTFAGQPRHTLVRLNASGSLDTSVGDPNGNVDVIALALRPDGKLWVGGNFTSIGGQTRGRLARFNANGTLDATFDDPNADFYVRALVPMPDGRLLAGGGFSNVGIGGSLVSRKGLVRFTASGTIDATFADPDANSGVLAAALQADGKTLVGGYYTFIGGAAHSHMARLQRDGTVEANATFNFTFNAGANAGSVSALAWQPDGKLLAAGSYSELNGQPRKNIVRLTQSGTVDATFVTADMDQTIGGIAVQADGKVIVVGNFTQIGGQPRAGLARLGANGTLDLAFAPASPTGIARIAVQANGKIVVASNTFISATSSFRGHVQRFNADGSTDGSLIDPDSTGSIGALTLQPDGKILVGGEFTALGGVARTRVARLNTDGSVDTLFVDAGVTCVACNAASVLALVVQPDGSVLIGGAFDSVGGQARTHLARLNSNGSLDTSFVNPGFASSNFLYAVAPRADGKLYVAGNFTDVGGQTRRRLARLNANGSLDAAFGDTNPTVSQGSVSVTALAIGVDGKLMVGGSFITIAGQSRGSLARLSVLDAVAQDLRGSSDGTTVTWTRAGAGPEWSLPPILAYSSDGITYTDLGPMSRIAGGWQRSGVPAPVAQSYYLRARGRSNAGLGASSQGWIESVRQGWVDDVLFADGFE